LGGIPHPFEVNASVIDEEYFVKLIKENRSPFDGTVRESTSI
jgi:hypothetical protein